MIYKDRRIDDDLLVENSVKEKIIKEVTDSNQKEFDKKEVDSLILKSYKNGYMDVIIKIRGVLRGKSNIIYKKDVEDILNGYD